MPGQDSGIPLFRRIYELGVALSNGDARRLIRAGRITVNSRVCTDDERIVSLTDFVGVTSQVKI